MKNFKKEIKKLGKEKSYVKLTPKGLKLKEELEKALGPIPDYGTTPGAKICEEVYEVLGMFHLMDKRLANIEATVALNEETDTCVIFYDNSTNPNYINIVRNILQTHIEMTENFYLLDKIFYTSECEEYEYPLFQGVKLTI